LPYSCRDIEELIEEYESWVLKKKK
jgi:hypothetical protein